MPTVSSNGFVSEIQLEQEISIQLCFQRNRSMKFSRYLVAALAAITILGTEVSADNLTFIADADAPQTFLFGTPNGTNAQGSANSQGSFGFRNADDPGTEGTRTRGQSFTFATGDGLTHDIGSFSVSLNTPLGNGFRPDGQLEFTIFEWDSNDPDTFTNWDSSTGGEFSTGHVEVYRQTFPVLGVDYPATANAFLAQISFDPGSLQLTDGTSYGFVFRYTLDSLVDDTGAPLSADVSFAFDTRQDNNLPGALLNTNVSTDFATADNGQSTSRDMNFFFAAPDTAILVGDVNCDGAVDFLDIGPFVDLLVTGTFLDKGDIDGSGTVDFLDIGPFIALL